MWRVGDVGNRCSDFSLKPKAPAGVTRVRTYCHGAGPRNYTAN